MAISAQNGLLSSIFTFGVVSVVFEREKSMHAFLEEFRTIFAHAGVRFIIIVGPLFYAFLYPLPYKNDIVTRQSVALVDMDQSTLSRRLIAMLESAPGIHIAHFPKSLQDAKKLLEEEKVFGIILVPAFFERAIYTSTPVHVELYANANYFLIYGAIANASIDVLNALSDAIKTHKSLFEAQIAKEHNLLSLQTIPLYNPSVGYLNYAIANVFIFILHQTLLIGASMLTCAQARFIPHFFGALSLVWVRCLCFSVIYIFLALLYFGVLFPYYGIHIHANPSALLGFTSLFLMATASCGVVLGTFLRKPMQATQIILLSSLPLVFMVGFIWPLELLPSFLHALLQIVPAYHGISAMVMFNQLGAPLQTTLPHCIALVGILICASLLGAWRLSRNNHETRT
ncbi:ABC transporter permease [Helicobacter salomonis]|uniref:ABC transporter permease n=2 Tax=Helicobacter salomonis TaxID=56878 RepID=UPI001FFA4052|nr:ABC transporter permease [Helicobacter salomonis]